GFHYNNSTDSDDNDDNGAVGDDDDDDEHDDSDDRGCGHGNDDDDDDDGAFTRIRVELYLCSNDSVATVAAAVVQQKSLTRKGSERVDSVDVLVDLLQGC
ncbi:hypothetical protein WUBG_13184, partial [Wuchereria bancrofti]